MFTFLRHAADLSNAGAGLASGIATVLGVGSGSSSGAGSSDGFATVLGVGGGAVAGVGLADGIATVAAVGAGAVAAVGASSGAATVSAVGSIADAWDEVNDPHWANVIYFNRYNGANGAAPDSATPDLSNYNQPQGGTTNALISTTSPIEGASSVYFDGAAGRAFVLYYPGPEGIIGTQDWTWESVVNLDTTQVNSAPAIIRLGVDKSVNWDVGHVVLHFDHPSHPDVLSLWVYNYSSTTALLVGTTNLAGLGDSHVGWSRVGDDWYLLARGTVEATATWSGSVGTTSLVRGFGGNNDSSPDSIVGRGDVPRETVGVGRYSSSYTAPWGT